MKTRATSRIIEDFLAAVEFRKIVAVGDDRVDANQQVILKSLTDALQSILDGEKPSAALAIQRRAKANPKTIHLALLMEIAKQRGDSWDLIENLATKLLQRSGRKVLTPERLKNIYRDHKLEARQMLRTVSVLRIGAERGAFEKVSEGAAHLMNVVHNLECFVNDPDSVSVERDIPL